MNTSKFSGNSRHQRGAALIVGLIMLLLFATPLFAGFANALVPLQAGNK